MGEALRKHWKTWLPWLILACVCIQQALLQQQDVLHLDTLDHPLFPFDPDNWIRLVQVRQWMQGDDFFDHAVRHTNAPFGGIVIHWTRPVDFMLMLLARLMPGALSLDQRLMAAAAWFPVLIGLAAVAFLVRTAKKFLNHTHVLWCLMSLLITNIATHNYFSPGDSDHHGTLCMLWCGVLCLIVKKPTKAQALMLGVALGLMLWISVEACLLIAPVYVILGLAGLKDAREMRLFSLAALGAALTSIIGLLVETPIDHIFHDIAYDTLSLPYVVLLSLCAAGVIFLDAAFTRLPALKPRLAAAAFSGGAILVAMFMAFPKFFKGPMVDHDPFIFTDFLPGIVEARSLFTTAYTYPPLFVVDIFQVALAAFLLFATRRGNIWRRNGRQMLILSGLLAYTFLMTAIQVRWNYYLQPVAMVVVAVLLPLWSILAKPSDLRWLRKGFPALARPYVILYILNIMGGILMYYSALTPRDIDSCDRFMQYDVQKGRVVKALGAKPLNLLTTTHLAGTMQFFTPYSVVAGNYNREAEGLKYLKKFYEATDAAQAKSLLEQRHINALYLCPAAFDDTSWLHTLSDKKNIPRWMSVVPVEKPKTPRPVDAVLFKINTSSARTR